MVPMEPNWFQFSRWKWKTTYLITTSILRFLEFKPSRNNSFNYVNGVELILDSPCLLKKSNRPESYDILHFAPLTPSSSSRNVPLFSCSKSFSWIFIKSILYRLIEKLLNEWFDHLSLSLFSACSVMADTSPSFYGNQPAEMTFTVVLRSGAVQFPAGRETTAIPAAKYRRSPLSLSA